MAATRKLIALLCGLAVPWCAQAQQAGDSLKPLAWLAGCWVSENAESGSGEQWMPLAGGTLLGTSRTVKNGKTVQIEFMQIREAANAKPVFIAWLPGQKETPFAWLKGNDTEAVFENLEHDFPQRVMYRLEGKTQLKARIEGLSKGVLKGIDFPMKRVSCDEQVGK